MPAPSPDKVITFAISERGLAINRGSELLCVIEVQHLLWLIRVAAQILHAHEADAVHFSSDRPNL